MGEIIPFRIERQADGELRISDVELAEKLGYADVTVFRRLIRKYVDLLNKINVLHFRTVTHGAKGGRPTQAYWLTEAQALFIISRSDMPIASDIMVQVAQAFVSMRRQLQQALPLPELFRLALINDQVRDWKQEFPDHFFQHLHRVLGLKRPSIGNHSNCAHFINRYVYAFLFGQLGLTAIREANPTDDEGVRAHRHHQVLKEKHLPKLRQHIDKIDTLLANAISLNHFDDMFNRAFPQPDTQIGMMFGEAPKTAREATQ